METEDHFEFKASSDHKMSARLAGAKQQHLRLKNIKGKEKVEKEEGEGKNAERKKTIYLKLEHVSVSSMTT